MASPSLPPASGGVPGRGYLEAGVGLGPAGSHCGGAVTGRLGNIPKVKCVHLDSSGDRGADSGAAGTPWHNQFIGAFITLRPPHPPH